MVSPAPSSTPAKRARRRTYRPLVRVVDPRKRDYLVLAHDGVSWRTVSTRHSACSCVHGQYARKESEPCAHIAAAIDLETRIHDLAGLLSPEQASLFLAGWKSTAWGIISP